MVTDRRCRRHNREIPYYILAIITNTCETIIMEDTYGKKQLFTTDTCTVAGVHTKTVPDNTANHTQHTGTYLEATNAWIWQLMLCYACCDNTVSVIVVLCCGAGVCGRPLYRVHTYAPVLFMHRYTFSACYQLWTLSRLWLAFLWGLLLQRNQIRLNVNNVF